MPDIDQLAQALQNAHAAGDTQAATALAAALRSMQGADNSPASMAAAIKAQAPPSLGQKVGMGIGDIGHGITQSFAHAPPVEPYSTAQEEADTRDLGKTLGPAYDALLANRERTWQDKRTASGDKGFEWGRLGGNILGAAPLMAAAAPAVPESLMGAVGMGGFTGGVNAGLMPVTSGDYGKGKAEQVGIGTVAGGLSTGATNVLGSTVNGVKSLFLSPETKFANNFNRALMRDGRTIDSAQEALSLMGPDAIPADLGGNVRGLAEAGATVPGKSLTAAQAVPIRQFGQAERIQDAALKATGAAHKDELIAKRGVLTRPLYDEAFAPEAGSVTAKSPQITDDIIEELLAQPEAQQGIKEGMDSIRRENILMRAKDPSVKPLDTMDYALKRNPETGQWEKVGTPNLRMIDAVKRGWDIMLESDGPDMVHPRTGTPTNKARQIAQFREELINRTENQLPVNPKYGTSTWAAARNQWKEYSKPIEALNTIDKVLESARDVSDVTGRLYGSPKARAKLEGLTTDPAKMQAFKDLLSNETTMAQTNRAFGNSRTAYRQAAQADMEDGAPIDTVFSLAKNPSLSNVIGHALQVAKQKLTGPSSAVADQMTPLYSNDPAKIAAAFDMLRVGLTEREQQTLMGRLIKKGAVPTSLMAGPGVASLMGP